MGDIVEASGLEKGTLYGHFSTKEELALLAFDYAWKDTSDKRLRNVETVSNASTNCDCTSITMSIPQVFQGDALF
jgi:AcrR family transcriptional regulator